MKVAHVAFECVPIYKTGGLGDVVGSLPQALVKRGIETVVVMPGYSFIKKIPYLPDSQVPVFYIKSKYFDTHIKVRDPQWQARAYAYFAMAVLEDLKRRDYKPDIIHCHDWHTGLIPFLLKHRPDAFFEKTQTVLTVHNIGYQGKFLLKYLNGKEFEPITKNIEKDAVKLSFLRLGILNTDYLSTVSPNHAREIKTRKVGFGLSGAIRSKRGKFSGIINGLDYSVWNPQTDKLLTRKYSVRTVRKGKQVNKMALQAELGLAVDDSIPMYGFISRLSEQKGIDTILPLLPEFSQKRMQLVILGTGEKKYEQQLKHFSTSKHGKWISVNIMFDEKLARRIYGASDFFLIPSHYEPCGLTQMISMKYGSIPAASNVGGLKDTINDGKTGFLFKENTTELKKALQRTLTTWENQVMYRKMQLRVMRKDFSWDSSAADYERLYHKLKKGRQNAL